MWYKALLCLIFRLVAVSATTEALEMLMLIPREKLVALIDREAETDPFFGRMMYDLAEMMIAEGIVPHAARVGDPRPTQSVGLA